jgi:hypothetical protein
MNRSIGRRTAAAALTGAVAVAVAFGPAAGAAQACWDHNGWGDKASWNKDGFGDRKDGFGDRKDGFGNRKDGFGDRKDGFGDRRDGGDGWNWDW